MAEGADGIGIGVVVTALIAVRLAAVIWLVPYLSRYVPTLARLGLAICLALVLAESGAVDGASARLATDAELAPWTIGALAAKELLVGITVGLVIAVVFWAVAAGGRLIDVARGRQFGAAPTTVETLLFFLAVSLVLTLDGHHLLIEALRRSLAALPVDQWPVFISDVGESGGGAAALEAVVHIGSSFFTVAVAVALPVLAVALLIDLGTALTARIAPQLELHFLQLPAKTLVGLLILLVTLIAAVDIFIEPLMTSSDAIDRLLERRL